MLKTSGLKFYICVKDFCKLNDVKTNSFIEEVFNKTKDVNIILRATKPSLFKDRIYHTSPYSDAYLIGEDFQLYKINDLKDFLVEFNFELDDATKRLLEKKQNDIISIMPIRYSSVCKKTMFNIIVVNADGDASYNAVTENSIYDELMNAYKFLRMRNKSCFKITKSLLKTSYNSCLYKM